MFLSPNKILKKISKQSKGKQDEEKTSDYIFSLILILIGFIFLLNSDFNFNDENTQVSCVLIGIGLVIAIGIWRFLGIVLWSVLVLPILGPLFYLPFSKVDLTLDLGLLILKHRFVWMLIVALDIFILYNLFKSLRDYIKEKMQNRDSV